MTDEPGGLERIFTPIVRAGRATAYLLAVRERELEQKLADAHVDGHQDVVDQLKQELAWVTETRQQLETEMSEQLG